MKVVFFGLGSIGRRHLGLLQTEPSLKSGLSLYAVRSSFGGSATPNGIEELAGWKEFEQVRPDAAFICNPTSRHIETALECAKRGVNLFLEKPIGSGEEGLDDLLEAVDRGNLTAYVAYPLRFHPGVEALRRTLRQGGFAGGHVRAVVSSYLPNWRPGTDHLQSYSARRELGGGVILDLSHEFDLMEYVFGSVSRISGKASRGGNVTLDCEDRASAVFSAGDYGVNLDMTFSSMHPQRTIEVDLPGRYLKLDLLSHEITTKAPEGTRVEKFEVGRDEIFLRQLKYFLENTSNPRLMNNLNEASPLFRKILAFRKEASL